MLRHQDQQEYMLGLNEVSQVEFVLSELRNAGVELEAKSAKTNTEIVTKVITKQQVIKEKGEEVIKYIDREIVKYDNTCKLPKELLEAHNKSAAK